MAEYVLDRAKIENVLLDQGIKSISQLSTAANVHRNSLYPLINGERSPFTEVYLAVCNSLGIKPIDLLTTKEDPLDLFIAELSQQVVEEFSSASCKLVVFLFGSRATNTHRKFSDFDLGLSCGEKRLDGFTFLQIKEYILERSDDLPVKTDIVNFDGAPLSFLQDFEGKLVYLAGNRESLMFLRGKIFGAKSQ